MSLIEKIDAEITYCKELADEANRRGEIQYLQYMAMYSEARKIKDFVLSEQKEPCGYCRGNKSLGFVDIVDNRIFIDINGQAIRIFDEEYPGVTEHIDINFCPMCGRPLNQSPSDTA